MRILSIYGNFKKMLLANGKKSTVDSAKFDWADAICDSFILSMIAFFASLGGCGAIGTPTSQMLIAAGLAGCAQFFVILALKRKLTVVKVVTVTGETKW